MKSASMRKMMECLMVVLMVWSVFQIRNCITLQDVQYAQDRIHWDILAYELLFLASCFGFVTAMGTGILNAPALLRQEPPKEPACKLASMPALS